jgi:hypothetical protein
VLGQVRAVKQTTNINRVRLGKVPPDCTTRKQDGTSRAIPYSHLGLVKEAANGQS